MNNLMTRKIIFGTLMTLVLAFGVQGIADAVNGTDDTIGVTATRGGTTIATTEADLSWLNINDTITIPDVSLNNSSVKESISVSVSGGGANFPDPDSTTNARTTSQTWTEVDLDGTPAGHIGGDDLYASANRERPVFGGVAITVRSAGEVTVTVSWTSDDAPNSDRNKTQKFTFYVVKRSFEVGLNDTVRLLGATNGVGAGYGATDDFRIHSGDGRHNRVRYEVDSGADAPDGVLYIKEGNRYFNDASDNGVFDDGEYIERDDSGRLMTSSSADVWLRMADASQTVTATVVTPDNETEAVYILRVPRLAVTAAVLGTDGTHTVAMDPQQNNFMFADPVRLMGESEEVIPTEAIKVQVRQSSEVSNQVVYQTNVPNVLVKFDVADKSVTGGYLIPQSADIVDANNILLENIPNAARTLYVRATGGTAAVGFQFGTAEGTSDVIVSVAGTRVNIRKTVDVLIGDETDEQLSISSNTRDSGNSNVFNLVARVEDKDGDPVWGKSVTFRTRFGNLESTPTGEAGIPYPDSNGAVNDFGYVGDVGTRGVAGAPVAQEGLQVQDITTRSGLAYVIYELGTNTGRQEIFASIDDTTNARQEVTFFVNGPAGSGGDDGGGDDDVDDGVDDTASTITVIPGSFSDEPGTVATLAVAADGETVRVTGSSAFTTAGGTVTGAGASRTVTLPNTAGDYSLTVSASGYDDSTIPITVTGAVASAEIGTLSISPSGLPTNGVQGVNITARTAAGAIPSGALTVTLSGTGFTTTSAIALNGFVARVPITLPTTAGNYTLFANATGYGSTSVILTGGATTQDTGSSPAGGEADSIEIDGQRRRSGTVNEAARLRVRVLDANDNGVSDVRVTFRVLAPGRGTFAGARGNGRAVSDQTDRSGYASASLTPSDDGDLIVRASAAGVSADVTFIIDVGEASTTGTTDTETPGTATPRATTSRAPVVHVGAASRPPMLWVEEGAIYALVGASEQRFAPGVDNALNLAIGGGKVYWTEKTGESGGTINSANLNGSGVTELASIFATPMGIAVDVTNSKLYWTNSSGRIQSANLDGSRITNVLQNLPGPKDIAVARGNVYWTQYDATAGAGNVGIVNPTAAQTVARYISTGSDTPGSVVVGGNKVYWTEMTGESGGTVNSANLSGTGVTQLASILAVPVGIAVDGARSKLYWTNSRGRIQSANLDGSGIKNVVSGLGSPGELVLSNSIATPTAATTTTATTASNAKYDVNSDGTVDNTDAGLVAAAMNTSNTRYDVNGDGTVNFLDLLLVFDNRDDNAAGAPTIVGMKLSAVQIDIIEEQIDLLIATNDRSPSAMRVLIYLQQLLVTARPEKTQLLANYPNPFNPETWIPYELATDTDVRITIYNTQGVVIRTLQFGHQSAGYYTGRDRAAYWDGRNALGEQVASGLYFYQLETDEMSLMRKMVILK